MAASCYPIFDNRPGREVTPERVGVALDLRNVERAASSITPSFALARSSFELSPKGERAQPVYVDLELDDYHASVDRPLRPGIDSLSVRRG